MATAAATIPGDGHDGDARGKDRVGRMINNGD